MPTDVPTLQARIRDLERQLLALKNYEDEYNRCRQDSERQKEQLHAIGVERERLRVQLDRMTSIEGKLLELRSKADSAEVVEGERNELANQVKNKDKQLQQLQRDKSASDEALKKLQRENRELQEQANNCRKSVDELQV